MGVLGLFVDNEFLSAAFGILQVVALWLIFTKANVEGWKALIPFYGIYVECKVAHKEGVFQEILGGLIGILVGLAITLSSLPYAITSTCLFDGVCNTTASLWLIVGLLIILASTIVTYVFEWQMYKGLAKMFGQETIFAVGLLLLPAVFLAILAFGDAKYNSSVEATSASDTVVGDASAAVADTIIDAETVANVPQNLDTNSADEVGTEVPEDKQNDQGDAHE